MNMKKIYIEIETSARKRGYIEVPDDFDDLTDDECLEYWYQYEDDTKWESIEFDIYSSDVDFRKEYAWMD